MDHSTVERLAREAGLADFGGNTEANLTRFASLIRAEALEEAAKTCEQIHSEPRAWNGPGAEICATAIRTMAKEQQ